MAVKSVTQPRLTMTPYLKYESKVQCDGCGVVFKAQTQTPDTVGQRRYCHICRIKKAGHWLRSREEDKMKMNLTWDAKNTPHCPCGSYHFSVGCYEEVYQDYDTEAREWGDKDSSDGDIKLPHALFCLDCMKELEVSPAFLSFMGFRDGAAA